MRRHSDVASTLIWRRRIDVDTLMLFWCHVAYPLLGYRSGGLLLNCSYYYMTQESKNSTPVSPGPWPVTIYLRNRSALAVNCCIIIHCLEVSCKEDQITSAQRKWFIFVQLTDKQWIITQQFTYLSWSISILTQNKWRKHIWSLQLLPSFRLCTEELPPILRLRRIRLHVFVTSFTRKKRRYTV